MTAWLFVAGIGLLITLVLLALTRDPANAPLITDIAGWHANQPISANELDPPVIRAWEDRFPEFGEVVNRTEPLLIYCRPPVNGSPFELGSPTFPAPEYVSLLVLGNLQRPGNHVYLERADSQERFFVRTQTALRYWQRATYHMPAGWIGRPVRLRVTVEPSPTGSFVGISNPRALNRSAVLRSHLSALGYLAGYVIALALFIAPGLAASLWYAHWRGFMPILVVPLALVGSSLLGYLGFWMSLLGPSVYRSLAWAVALAGPVALVWIGKRRRLLLRSDDIRAPLSLWILVGLFYVAVTFSFDLGKPGAAHVTTRFLDEEISIDAHLPSLFAHELSRRPLKPPAWVLNWKSSDRPPLQAGIVLLQRPLAEAVGLTPWGLYLPLGCVLQCAWVPALWAVFRAAGLSHRRSGIALLLTVFSGFVLVNAVFVWPKMLSAALTLIAVLFGVFQGVAPIGHPWARAVILGFSAALAALAHAGALFTLLPLGALLLLPAWSPGMTKLFVAGGGFLALWLPWSWFQSLDPPGDRLMKMLLAGAEFHERYTIFPGGQIVVDAPFTIGGKEYPERTPFWRALAAAYGRLSFLEILEHKWDNLRVLFIERADVVENIHQSIPTEPATLWRGFRRREFFNLFWALGLLNLGWAVLLAGRWRGNDVGLGTHVLYVAAASLAFWVLLVFGPGTTVMDQGPFATFLLLFGLLSAALSTLPRYALWLLFGTEGVLFTAAWLLTSVVTSYALMNPVMIFLAAAFLVGVTHQALFGLPPGEGCNSLRITASADRKSTSSSMSML
jgi:hypothetical protein